MSQIACRIHRTKARRGGTTFQVVLFLMVTSLGVWLGAQYSGVDVQHLAYTALDETQVIDRIPEQWRPKAPLPELGDGPGQVSFEQRASDLLQELEGLRSEVASVRQGANKRATSGSRSLPSEFARAPAMRRQATLAYWTRLRQITGEVTELHDGVELALSTNTVSHVFDIRQRAFDYGARAIDSVDSAEVDQQAADAGFRIAQWYCEGAELYSRASDLWEGRVSSSSKETMERSLEHAKEQHASEADLVRTMVARTEEILMRRYAVEFPVLSL